MIKQSELDELIEYYPVLHDLPAQLRRVLQSEARSFQVPIGHVVFEVDSPCGEYLMALKGSIRVVKPASQGREILLYRVVAGTVCVLTVSCLLGSIRYAGRGVIEAQLTAVLIPRAFFLAMLDTSQSFRLHIFHNFIERYIQLTELVEAVAFGKLDERLAALLLGRGTLIQITHQRLAEELGSSREVISRILESFQDNGIVGLERGKIRILDRRELVKIAAVGDAGHRQLPASCV